MYTTLAMLKEARACIPGYTRMVSFFSTRQSVKDLKIPLFMIPIIGEPDDCEWTINNGAVFDKDEYEAFRARHLPWVIRNLFQAKFVSEEKFDGTIFNSRSAVRAAMTEFFEARTDEAIIAWVDKWSLQNHNHWIWQEVLDNECLRTPARFIIHVMDRQGDPIKDGFKLVMLRRDWANVDPLTFHHKTGSSSSNSDEEESEDCDMDDDGADEDDDDEAPRRRWKTRHRVQEPDSGEEGLSADELKAYRLKQLGQLDRYSIPKKYMEVGLPKYVCPFYDESVAQPIRVARLLCQGDPFQRATEFIAEHNLAETVGLKGFMLSKANEKEPPGYHLTVNLSDPKMIFTMFHVMRSGNMNVAEMFGVNNLSGDVSELLSNTPGSNRIGRNANSLDRYEAVTESDGTVVTLSRVED